MTALSSFRPRRRISLADPVALLLPVFSLALATPGLAADDPEANGGWDVVVTAATDNRSKGQSKTLGDGFVGMTGEWRSSDGLFYAGPGFETIDDNGAYVELNSIVGVRPEIAGFAFNFSAAYKWRVNSDPGVDDDEFELTADVERTIGPAAARLRVQYAPDAGGGTKSFTWIEARLGWTINERLEATTTLGRRDRVGGDDYAAWDAGFTYALDEHLDLDLRYYDTNRDNDGVEYADTVVASLALAF